MTEELGTELGKGKIKQTRLELERIRFRDDAINKVRKENYDFGSRRYLYIPFKVSKDSHQKGLKLKILKGEVGSKHTPKIFYIVYWFNGKSVRHKIGNYSQSFGTKECDEYLIKLHRDHTDPKTGYWIKDPNITKRDEKRIVEKPDTTKPMGYTINEVIEAYCGAPIYDQEAKRGMSKDRKDGYRTSKSAKNWFRYMCGYNQRQTLITWEDDTSGYCREKFL